MIYRCLTCDTPDDLMIVLVGDADGGSFVETVMCVPCVFATNDRHEDAVALPMYADPYVPRSDQATISVSDWGTLIQLLVSVSAFMTQIMSDKTASRAKRNGAIQESGGMRDALLLEFRRHVGMGGKGTGNGGR